MVSASIKQQNAYLCLNKSPALPTSFVTYFIQIVDIQLKMSSKLKKCFFCCSLYCSDIHFLFPYHMYMHAIIVGRDADEKQNFVAQMKIFLFLNSMKMNTK